MEMDSFYRKANWVIEIFRTDLRKSVSVSGCTRCHHAHRSKVSKTKIMESKEMHVRARRNPARDFGDSCVHKRDVTVLHCLCISAARLSSMSVHNESFKRDCIIGFTVR